MKKLLLLAPIAALSLVTMAGADEPAPSATPVTATIVNGSGATIGSVTLTPAPTGVLLRLAASGLEPGWHGIHFHATGDCSDSGFMKSGGHINHAENKAEHGLLNPKGPDFGDLPNIHAGADGSANAEIFTSLVRLGSTGDRPDLLDADGSALVIHAGADDHLSQPIGGAGARVGCAVINR